MILFGSYDLDIIEECNLHCAGCTSLDYLGYDRPGKVTISSMTVAMLEELLLKIGRHVTKIEELSLVGGEPTLHPRFEDIIDTLRESGLVGKINVVTNGTNFTPEIIEILKKVDCVQISDYMRAADGDTIFETIDDMPFDYNIWHRSEFHRIGECEPMSPQENWNACFMKDYCRVITMDGLARCRVCSNEQIHIAPWHDEAALTETISRHEAYDRCGTCGTPASAEHYEWSSLKPEIDAKNYKRGIELIKAVTL